MNETKIDIIGGCIMTSCSANSLQPAISLFENQCSPAISWSYRSTTSSTRATVINQAKGTSSRELFTRLYLIIRCLMI